MTIKQFLTIISGASLLCWATVVVMLWNVDPFEATPVHFLFFYMTLFLAIAGTVSSILYMGYHLWGDVQVPVFRYVKKSMGQGVAAAGIATVLLVLQANRFLNLWTLLIIVLLIAFYFSLTFTNKQTTV